MWFAHNTATIIFRARPDILGNIQKKFLLLLALAVAMLILGIQILQTGLKGIKMYRMKM